MNTVFRLTLVDPLECSRTAIKNVLRGLDFIWLEAECSRYDFFCDVVWQTQPDIALISLDANPQQGLALVVQLANEQPDTSVLVVSGSEEGSVILAAMRNGAKDFLSSPLRLEDFLSAIKRIRTMRGGRTDAR